MTIVVNQRQSKTIRVLVEHRIIYNKKLSCRQEIAPRFILFRNVLTHTNEPPTLSVITNNWVNVRFYIISVTF